PSRAPPDTLTRRRQRDAPMSLGTTTAAVPGGRGALVAPRSVAGGALEGGTPQGRAQLRAEEVPRRFHDATRRQARPSPGARSPKGEDGKGRSGPPVNISSGPAPPHPPAVRMGGTCRSPRSTFLGNQP